MYVVAVVYFIFVFFLLGLSVRQLFSLEECSVIEKIISNIAIGLAVFPLLLIVLNWFHLIYWWVILIISAIVPTVTLLRSKAKLSVTLPTKRQFLVYSLLIILFAFHLFVFTKGAFVYPYLEDEDPMQHALAAQYVSKSGTYSTPVDDRITHYLPPYPPFYSSLMGVHLSLAGEDIVWVLKFFNALIISLGVFFIFQLVKLLTNSELKGLLAAFLLIGINSYLSHFIFAASYATTMMIPALYFLFLGLSKAKKQQPSRLFSFERVDWKMVSFVAIIFSAVFLIQPITSAIFLLFLVILFFTHLKDARLSKFILFATIMALVLSQLFWLPALIKFSYPTFSEVLGFNMFENAPGGLNNDTSGGIIYSLGDYVFAPVTNKIDQPVGVGLVLFIACCLAIIFFIVSLRRLLRQDWFTTKNVLAVLIWLCVVAFMIQGNAFPVKFTPHRLWAYFSLGVVIFTVVAGGHLLKYIRRITKSPLIIPLLLLVLFIGVVFTGLVPKYKVQTSFWPPGGAWTSQEELQGYLEVSRTLAPGTPVFVLCGPDEKIASSNLGVVFLVDELSWVKQNPLLIPQSSPSFDRLLQANGYSYFIIDGACVKEHGLNETNMLLTYFANEGYEIAFSNKAFFLFEV